jgi:arylsulfatase A-like enzyme
MTSRPNIVFLIADDHRHQSIGANGCAEVSTPHLDALAARGVSFDRAHCQGGMHPAVCVPSRASLMTGRNIFASSQDPTGQDYEGAAFAIPTRLETFPQRLRASGYHTHAIGKWHNDRAAFARSFTSADRIMFGGMSDHDRVPLNRFDPSGVYPTEAIYFEPGFSTDQFCASAQDFLRSHDGVAPFCLYVAFTAPHDPRTPPPEHRVDPSRVTPPANLLAVHPFDNGEMMVRDERLDDVPRTQDMIRRHMADYYGMISHLDAAIGAIVATLREAGQLDNTIIVYTADHGLALGQHGLLGKQNLYEHSTHVPLILAGPGIPAGLRHDALVWHADTTATMLELAGLRPDPAGEGSSLLPLMHGQIGSTRRYFATAYGFVQRSVRDRRYKLIRYVGCTPTTPRRAERFGPPTSGSGTEQLFDLDVDPLEMVNLAFQAELQGVRHDLLAALRSWQEEVDDPMLHHERGRT